MAFDWLRYFTLAQELSQDVGKDEARLRTAISRAYYASFILARNHLRDKDRIRIQFNNTAHTFVIKAFSSSQSAVRQNIGSKLKLLRELRNLADYEDNLITPSRRAKKAMRLAEEVINALAQL